MIPMLAAFVMIDGILLESVVIYHCTGKLGLDGGGAKVGKGEKGVSPSALSCYMSLSNVRKRGREYPVYHTWTD